MGAVNTEGKFEMKYGYVEARMKLPKQVGHWPGVWLMGKRVLQVGNMGRNGTEIDIVECPWRNKDEVSHALHCKPSRKTTPFRRLKRPPFRR